jgi:hypothetical protein
VRAVLVADLFDTEFVEVGEAEIGGFVAELEEAVESSTGSARGQHLGALRGGAG